ncbi:hypothetical protein F2Q69_00011342 [Brassica cretica]|uniref:Uncharacterized protein n=1 Tax=Brassica cretica TaxID=69181 RepID=A0A8S9R5Y1_BRACR|nr:hypothetical protein F2Q69_00011342 [Brassica cretica]
MAGPRIDSQRLKTVAGGGETVTAMIMIDEGGCAMSSHGATMIEKKVRSEGMIEREVECDDQAWDNTGISFRI